MKKKFTKERFYKRLDAQCMANFDFVAFAQSTSAAQIAFQEIGIKMKAIRSSALELRNKLSQLREHGTLSEPKEWVIYARKRVNQLNDVKPILPFKNGEKVKCTDGSTITITL